MEDDAILNAVYRIRGLSDPNNTEPFGQRLDEIYELARLVIRETGYEPPFREKYP